MYPPPVRCWCYFGGLFLLFALTGCGLPLASTTGFFGDHSLFPPNGLNFVNSCNAVAANAFVARMSSVGLGVTLLCLKRVSCSLFVKV